MSMITTYKRKAYLKTVKLDIQDSKPFIQWLCSVNYSPESSKKFYYAIERIFIHYFDFCPTQPSFYKPLRYSELIWMREWLLPKVNIKLAELGYKRQLNPKKMNKKESSKQYWHRVIHRLYVKYKAETTQPKKLAKLLTRIEFA